MAEIVWTEPALSDLDAIADFIALDNPPAAQNLVLKVFQHVEILSDHPEIGSKPAELEGWHYRQIVEPPVRVLYRPPIQSISYIVVQLSRRSCLND